MLRLMFLIVSPRNIQIISVRGIANTKRGVNRNEYCLSAIFLFISRIVSQRPTGKTKIPIKLKNCAVEKKNCAGSFRKEGPGKKGDNAINTIMTRVIITVINFLCLMICTSKGIIKQDYSVSKSA